MHSFPRDQLNKSHGGHVGVPERLIKIILNWNTNMAAVTSFANYVLYKLNLVVVIRTVK
jgi:hypothetical protein